MDTKTLEGMIREKAEKALREEIKGFARPLNSALQAAGWPYLIASVPPGKIPDGLQSSTALSAIENALFEKTRQERGDKAVAEFMERVDDMPDAPNVSSQSS